MQQVMKTLSIILLVVTTIYAAITDDGTAFGVASVLFVRECGKDIIRIWRNAIETNGHDY